MKLSQALILASGVMMAAIAGFAGGLIAQHRLTVPSAVVLHEGIVGEISTNDSWRVISWYDGRSNSWRLELSSSNKLFFNANNRRVAGDIDIETWWTDRQVVTNSALSNCITTNISKIWFPNRRERKYPPYFGEQWHFIHDNPRQQL